MIDIEDITPAEKDGRYEFVIHYSGQEHICRVEKEQNKLHVNIDNGTNAELQIGSDGIITQTDGSPLPESTIDYIKKNVLGHNV